jgi:hypothetical protein
MNLYIDKKMNKINKNINVSFVKDVKGKTYAKNPFPDGFLIENKYVCKCYTYIIKDNIEKIKIYLVNPENKKDFKINIIDIRELNDMMLLVYTKETVDNYFQLNK